MSTAEAVAAVVFLGVLLYSVFGGADFGSGVWDLTAGDRRRGGAVRRLVDHAIGPVWEANHVWLIFILVFLWTGYPRAFVSIVSTLYVPLSIAALGIVLRGSGFAFRKYAPDAGQAQLWGIAFAASSVITPFFLGTVAGAIASGRVPADGVGDRWDSWTTPTSLLGGVMAVVVSAFLAAVFLARDAQRLGRVDLVAWFRVRALGSGVVAGAVAIVGIAVLAADAPTLFDGLTGRAAPLMVVSAIGGLAALRLLWVGRHAAARWAAVVAVAAVVLGWGVAQWPDLLVDEVTITDAAGAPATLVGLLIGFGLAGVLVVPALVLLLVMVDRGTVAGDETS